MWICLNDAFFSIVASNKDPNRLNVRARRKEHLANHFPGHSIHVLLGRDYPFRCFVARSLVADALAERIRSIGYANFKSSVADGTLQEAYADVWAIMRGIQR